MRWITRALLRAFPSPRVRGVSVHTVRDGKLSVRIYRPTGPARSRPGLLWVHGGGLVVGSARQDDGLCARTAAALDAIVVSVDYRLAPEHPYPAAIDDTYVAWKWLLTHANELGIDVKRVAIGGESAGGGLAANLVHRVHDAGGAQPVAQWLFAPMLDDRTAADRSLDGIDHLVWNNCVNRYGWTAYLQQPPGGERTPPYASAAPTHGPARPSAGLALHDRSRTVPHGGHRLRRTPP